jgi:hypothetical protein
VIKMRVHERKENKELKRYEEELRKRIEEQKK